MPQGGRQTWHPSGGGMADYLGLLVWQEAHELVLAAYEATRTFPAEERFDLTRQIRRSAASVPANLAEGFGKIGNMERARFTNIALGSTFECDYHLLLARYLGYLTSDTYQDLKEVYNGIDIRKVSLRDVNTCEVTSPGEIEEGIPAPFRAKPGRGRPRRATRPGRRCPAPQHRRRGPRLARCRP